MQSIFGALNLDNARCIAETFSEGFVSYHTMTLRENDLYLAAFGLNTERCSVFLRIQSECGKLQTRKTLNTKTFYGMRRSLGFPFIENSALIYWKLNLILNTVSQQILPFTGLQ